MASAFVKGDTDREQRIRANVRKYHFAIVKRIDPEQMLSSPAAVTLKALLGEQNVQVIRSVQDKCGLLSAAKRMFYRMEQCERTGIWITFCELIRKDNYERIIDILDGNSSSTDDEHMSRIDQIGPDVIDKIFPVAVLDHLGKWECLTKEDHENISVITTNQGPITGSRLLMKKLSVSKKRNWYECFLQALTDSNQKTVAEQLDTKSFNFVPEAATSSIDSNAGEADSTEVKYFEEDGEREFTCRFKDIGHGRSNLAAPSTFSKDVMHGSLMTSFDLKAGIKAPVDQGETVCDGPSNRFKDLAQLEEDGFKQRKPIKLRGYQEELAEAGLEGKNCMIVAPTGSGKTHVALKIIEEHLSASHENRKVAILVKDVVLAEQHTESCKAHLPRELRTKLITGGNDEQISLSRLLQDFDVFVMTVQILADALAFDEFYILSEFTMIVFDECHHTLRKHPYNVVMSSYLDEKLREGGPRRPLPQMAGEANMANLKQDRLVCSPTGSGKSLCFCVVDRLGVKTTTTGDQPIIGLTASTGVGKAKDILQAKEHIKKLCANLDVEKICTVKRGLRELSKVVNTPDVEIHLVGGRLEDHFAAFVQKWMIDIESKIKNHCRYWTKIEDPPPGRRDCLEYKQWISRIIETVVRRPDSQLYCMSCIRFAEICNDALIINQNVRTRDALNYMSNQIHEMDVSRFTDIEKELFAIFQENLDYLNEVCGRPASANPKLEKMKKLILWVFNEDPDSRVIIFAKFRKLAQALVGWMTETDGLSSLNAQKLVGQGAEEDGGMSQAKQGDVRKGFREGSHKVIVATSVAEEGLDIQKCNMVILYDYDTNEISKVQTRGRARAEDSRYVLLVSEGKGIAEKDELNTMREVLMENAVWDLQEEIEENPRGFVDVTRGIQINCKKERDLKRLMEQNRQFIKGTFQLRCKKCDTLACYNYDIRQFESTHRAVISEDFCDRADISLHPKPTKFTIAKKGKVWCAKCGYDWGIVACYRSKNLFVIKIVAFVAVDYEGRRSTFKKWTDVRFEIDDFQQGDRDSCDRVSERIATRLAECELKGK